MNGRAIFFDRMKACFDEEYPAFTAALKRKANKSIYLNLLKAPLDKILALIDFKHERSAYNPLTYYYEIEGIGKSALYDLGLIYPQEVSASVPAYVLNPQRDSLIVDMCAAPGGKCINLANITQDEALIIANEVDYKRAQSLITNIERLGIGNILITNKNGAELAADLEGQADYVLLDAPCSGEGMIRKNPAILATYSQANINSLAKRQAFLLDCAYQILKEGGELVYSTCTFAIEENEQQVAAFLKRHRDVTLLPLDVRYARRGLAYPGLDSAALVRLTPLENCEGQFIAHFKKGGERPSFKLREIKEVSNPLVESFIQKEFNLNNYYLYEDKGHFSLTFKALPDLKRHVLRTGIDLGVIRKGIFFPAHALYRANKTARAAKHVLAITEKEYFSVIAGESIYRDIDDGYYLLSYQGFPLAFTKAVKGELKNKYPHGLRRR